MTFPWKSNLGRPVLQPLRNPWPRVPRGANAVSDVWRFWRSFSDKLLPQGSAALNSVYLRER